MQLKLPKLSVDNEVKINQNHLISIESKELGSVYTRPEVVNLILDLIGYTTDKPLYQMRLIEPSFGNGSFLLPAIERLVQSYKNQQDKASKLLIGIDLPSSIRAVEINSVIFEVTSQKVTELLIKNGFTKSQSENLVKSWLIKGDFLLEEFGTDFTYVVGNPPYIRQELIPATLIAEYRRRYKTIYDRADIYIPFIEKSLALLEKKGTLGFICSDRWMKNRYGGPLRRLINDKFYFKYHIDMNDAAAFHSNVIAYPAITVIQNDKPAETTVLSYSDIQIQTQTVNLSIDSSINSVKAAARNGIFNSKESVKVLEVKSTNAPWILNSSKETELIRRLEDTFPTIEQVGCKVGIGVATGADRAFIGKFDELEVESDRKLPMVMTRDIVSGVVQWRGYGIINPFSEYGGLVPLCDYPKLGAYLEKHEFQIKGRHVAKRSPENWYRTIDRIYPALTKIPKLLIPDINGDANIVFEDGEYYPHHNLYYITSENWDLRALQAVLLSGVAKLFVSAYSTRMRGGFLRFQAQYLRRIRLPRWQSINEDLRAALMNASRNGDSDDCRRIASEIYGLTNEECKILEEINGKNGSNV